MKVTMVYDCAHCGRYHETVMTVDPAHGLWLNMRGNPGHSLCASCRFKYVNAYRAAKGLPLLPLDDYHGEKP